MFIFVRMISFGQANKISRRMFLCNGIKYKLDALSLVQSGDWGLPPLK